MDIVSLAIRNARLTLSIMFFFLIAGALAYQSMPKEAEPDIQIPIIYVSLAYQGISPEDSERLLLRPVETRMKEPLQRQGDALGRLPGRRLRAGRVQAGADLSTALEDVRAKVQDAKRDLPQAAEEPTVNEVNLSEFPVLVVTLSGNVPERALTAAARELRDRIEEVPGVLEARAAGRARGSRRGHHRSGEAVLLRAAARPADPGRRRRATAWWRPATSKARKAATPSRCRR